MRIGLLGPLQLQTGERLLAIHSAQQRALLAVLLLHANRVVATDRLNELLWGESRPKQARNILQVQASRLRRLLAAGGEADRLTFRAPGYLLRVEPGELDLAEFQRLADHGRQALTAGDAERAGRLLREALDLWRGQALEDVEAPALLQQRARLEQRRLAALEARIDADMRLGRHTELMAELEGLTAEHPLRELLWRQWILALYRGGRRADALAAYSELRGRLVEQLGIEPGAPLQELQRRILRADPALDARAAPVAAVPTVPHQLPLDVVGFAGRTQELARLEELFAGCDHEGSVAIAAIQGAGGVGKSALAVHLGHRLAARFPDGQLYVDLKGATAGLRPLEPLEVLGRFLRALGVDADQIPDDLDEAAARFRSQLAGGRVLLVLDNARDAAQVRPLLPASPGCAVLVTSRRLLDALEGAGQLHLEVLDPAEAVQLLGRIAGERRIAGEPEAAAALARCCGYLPLALRIAGSRLAARPGWTVAALAERLADQRHRLDELQLAEVGVRASFALSYQELAGGDHPLDRAAAAAFALLGVLDGPDVGVPVAARLLDRPRAAAERVLERLVDAQLLQTPTPGRYRLHDLLRLYARELAASQHPERQRTAALERALRLYAATAWQTLELLCPGDRRMARADPSWTAGALELADAGQALAWLEAERANLLAAVEQAATTPGLPYLAATQLAHGLFGFFLLRGHWTDWLRVSQAALDAAASAGDRAAQAHAHGDLGIAWWRLGRYQQALSAQQHSLRLYQALGDRHGQGASLTNLGIVYGRQGRDDQAIDCFTQSLAVDRELGDRHGQAISLANLAVSYTRLGRYREALGRLNDSVAITAELGDRSGQAIGLSNLGEVHLLMGHDQQALDCLDQGLAIHRELGDRRGQAVVLTHLGAVHRQRGHHDQALDCLRQALAIRQELGERHGEAETLRELGRVLQALGSHDQARAHWRQALEILRQLHSPEAEEVGALLDGEPEPSPLAPRARGAQ